MKRFMVAVLIGLMMLSVGCASKKVTTEPVPVVTTTSTTDTTVVPVPRGVWISSMTMEKVKSMVEYLKLSLAAIQAAMDKVQANMSDGNKYKSLIVKITPYVVTLAGYVDQISDAYANCDSTQAATVYNLARPLITTILKVGGPILIQMIF